jgi:protocatechuate 3,4-dioxygenase beta subunit
MNHKSAESPSTAPGMTRRRALAVFAVGAGAAAIGLDRVLAAPAAASRIAQDAVCVLTPEVTQGPYYLQHSLVRQDIAEGKSGFPLNLTFTVVDYTNSCAPVAGVPVEIWHCDVWGYYSGYTSAAPGGTVPALETTGDPSTFLRGVQVTDSDGLATFVSIVPGWYSPRVTHIHVKVHQGGDIGTTYENGSTVQTTQLLFADDVCQTYSVLEPYSQHQLALTPLVQDQVYNEALQAGDDPTTMVPTMTPVNPDSIPDGYDLTITLGIDPSATSSDTGGPGGGAGAPGGPPPGAPVGPGPVATQVPKN